MREVHLGSVWGAQTQDVQGALALLANTLVKYQPLVVYIANRKTYLSVVALWYLLEVVPLFRFYGLGFVLKL